MGFFRRPTPQPSDVTPRNASALMPSPTPQGWYGRRLSSELSVSECTENFSALVLQGGNDPRVFYPTWVGEAEAPEVLLGVRLAQDEALYLAIWARGSLKAAQREIALIPPGFDTSPIPLPGQWKTRDPSLSSIGWVTDFAIALPPRL